MPFGLINAPATFQRIINSILRQYLDIFVVYYLDNILIFSDNKEEHREHIYKVLKILQDAKLLVKPEKSHFHVQKVNFLGHTITPELTKKDKPFKWNDNAQEAFKQLKKAITSEPILAIFNPKKEIKLETDALDFALGGQISQKDNKGRLYPVAFYSCKLQEAELNYPIYNKEFLAIINCFREFRHYLIGSKHKVKVYTDHQNISYFATTYKLNRR
ncbi:uncharacterized protein FRV6_14219 [Fusarium oxysporum]|uniref:Reverse transcriptase domain-containing protein n=1 Tax=Fusarium oxysporum TaxID=5507 RepID=A0A2H3TWH5_FUSOX|nr:uncharacterized protein FRV6_14219 [Fusarium oxysporum]